jgi:hypothetical protein
MRAPEARLVLLAVDSEPCCLGDRLDSVGHAELAEDRGHVVGDGLLRHEQPVGDFGVGAAKKPPKSKAAPRNSYASLANYTAGFMTKGNNVPQGGDRYEPGFAGWASFATGYKASHPADFPG